MSIRSTKSELLEHYASKEPRKFYQIDAWLLAPDGNDVMRPDEDGDCLTGGETFELMSGGPAVRVLITAGTTNDDAIRQLKKAAKWLKRDPALTADEQYPDLADDGVSF